MYEAKGAGRNCMVFASDLPDERRAIKAVN
jgi:hypothetical protein